MLRWHSSRSCGRGLAGEWIHRRKSGFCSPPPTFPPPSLLPPFAHPPPPHTPPRPSSSCTDIVGIHKKPTVHAASTGLQAATTQMLEAQYKADSQVHQYARAKMESQKLAASECARMFNLTIARGMDAHGQSLVNLVNLALAVESKGHRYFLNARAFWELALLGPRTHHSQVSRPFRIATPPCCLVM